VLARIRETLAQWTQTNANGQSILSHTFPGYDLLTRHERDVLAQIASGASNKETSRQLKISPRKVEVTARASWKKSAPATPLTSFASC
jgi:two-component system, LuxR family, response regulator FixJ